MKLNGAKHVAAINARCTHPYQDLFGAGCRHRLFAQFKLCAGRSFVDPVRFHRRGALKIFDKDRGFDTELTTTQSKRAINDDVLDCTPQSAFDDLTQRNPIL